MRCCPIEVLGACTLVACVSSAFGFNKTDVDITASLLSDVRVHNSVSVNRVVMVHNITNAEERMPRGVGSLVSRGMTSLGQKALDIAMEALHVDRHAHMLTEEAWHRLRKLDRHLLEPFVEKLRPEGLKEFISSPAKEKSAHRFIIDPARASEDIGKHLMRAIFAPENRSAKKSYLENMDKTAELEHAFSILGNLVNELKWDELVRHGLLNKIIEVVGDAAKVAPALSIAKKSRVIRRKAEFVQDVMLESWLYSGKSVDDVYSLLGLPDLRKRAFAYENLDTLERYIDAFNTRNPQAKVDVFEYLQKKFNDDEFAMMLLRGNSVSRYARKYVERLLRQWLSQGKATEDLVRTTLSMATGDIGTLLDPLLVVCGGAANLAPAISLAKLIDATKKNAEQLQNAMLEGWLNESKTVDDVFKLLGISRLLQKKGGFTYKVLDTLEQYIVMFNKKHPSSKTDTFTLLRKNFTDARLARMIVGMTQIPRSHNLHYFQQWVGKGKSSADLVGIILWLTTDDIEKLLDPLLAAFGGPANLARVLSIVEMDPVVVKRAKQLKKAMLSRWLSLGEFPNDDFDLLGLSELRNTGFTYEKMDTLEQYIALRNEKYPHAKTSTINTLRLGFGDGMLILMILEKKGLVDYTTKVEAALIQCWRDEKRDLNNLPPSLLTGVTEWSEEFKITQYYMDAMTST